MIDQLTYLHTYNQDAIVLHPDIGAALRQLGKHFFRWKVDTFLDDDIVQSVMSYSENQAGQAQYLAEAIYLARYRAAGELSLGIGQLLTYLSGSFVNSSQAEEAQLRFLSQIDTPTRTIDEAIQLQTLLEQSPPLLPQFQVDEGSSQPLWDNMWPDQLTAYGDTVILPAQASYVVIGDTHGDATTTRHIINNILNQAKDEVPYIIFMGDYVNNGLKSIDNLIAMLSIQAKYPDRVICLSGNHDYRETYQTAVNEYFNKHWRAATDNPHPAKLPPQHYGHARLDFVCAFGAEQGEALSLAFDTWGRRLPYICLAPDGVMISHSVGKAKHLTQPLQWSDLLTAKTDDLTAMRQLGMAQWSANRQSQHSAMVNNRIITPDLLAEYRRLGVHHFIVGHTHYRSGDVRINQDQTVTTVCSSHPDSPDAGHYMFQEMMANRVRYRNEERLSPKPAYACYVSVSTSDEQSPEISIHPISGEL
ncbi:MAG: metallophosphoesterase [Chloroflexota bacterium]